MEKSNEQQHHTDIRQKQAQILLHHFVKSFIRRCQKTVTYTGRIPLQPRTKSINFASLLNLFFILKSSQIQNRMRLHLIYAVSGCSTHKQTPRINMKNATHFKIVFVFCCASSNFFWLCRIACSTSSFSKFSAGFTLSSFVFMVYLQNSIYQTYAASAAYVRYDSLHQNLNS